MLLFSLCLPIIVYCRTSASHSLSTISLLIYACTHPEPRLLHLTQRISHFLMCREICTPLQRRRQTIQGCHLAGNGELYISSRRCRWRRLILQAASSLPVCRPTAARTDRAVGERSRRIERENCHYRIELQKPSPQIQDMSTTARNAIAHPVV